MLTIATNLNQYLEACRLVYDRYLAAKLITPNHKGLVVHPGLLEKDARVFLAYSNQNELLYTATLIPDGPYLANNKLFPKEIQALRDTGATIAEIANLAGKQSLRLLLQFHAYIYLYGLQNGYTHYVISVHPKHAGYYEKFWNFYKYSEKIVPHPEYNNSPAVLLVMHLLPVNTLPALTKSIIQQYEIPIFYPEPSLSEKDIAILRGIIDDLTN